MSANFPTGSTVDARDEASPPRQTPLWAWPLAAFGIAGVTIGISCLFSGMGDIIEAGEQCSKGGPYIVAQQCPEGVTFLTLIGAFGGLLSLIPARWGLRLISERAADLVLLAWAGLFGALGYNFFYYAHNPPTDTTNTTAWIVSGVVLTLIAIPGIVSSLMAVLNIETYRRLQLLVLFALSIAVGILAGNAIASAVTDYKEVGGPVLSTPEQAANEVRKQREQLRQAQADLREVQPPQPNQQETLGSSGSSKSAGLIAPLDVCRNQHLSAGSLDARDSMLCMTNFARSAQGLKRYHHADVLDSTAGRKAADIFRSNAFSHQACGRDFEFWLRRYGYLRSRCWFAGENIAWGGGNLGTVRSIFQAWMNSTGHRQAILSKSYTDMGVGDRRGTFYGYSGSSVWVQHFGSQEC